MRFSSASRFRLAPVFLEVVTTTPEGLLFLAVGTIVGAVIATALFSVTVVSMPLLLDRDIDFVTAMITSVRAVAENPVAMLGFGVIVAVAAVVAMVPLFAGLSSCCRFSDTQPGISTGASSPSTEETRSPRISGV